MAINIPIVSSYDGKGISKALKDFKRLEGGAQKSAFGLLNADAAARKGIASFAKFTAIGAGVVGVIGSKLVSAAYESQKVMKQTEAIIKATGGAANLTAQQVADLSGRLSQQVGVDDELIQTSANLLLTFKQVQNQMGDGNKIFDRAIQASLDLGNVFGSTDAAAMQLGKALSDPVKGITALRRAGINFTDSQKEQIKTLVESGNTLDAQKLILKEVESQVGGTAAATATGFDKMKVAMENVAERLGELLLPFVERFSDFINSSLVPTLNTFADIVGERGLGAGVEFLSGKLVGAIFNMGAFGKVILTVTGAFVALRVATITYTAVQGVMRIASELATNALKQQAIQAAATKTSLIAAGGAVAVLAVAASAYMIYSQRKSEAVQKTKDFVAALKLEGEEQTNAIDEIYKSDKGMRTHIDVLTAMGYKIEDVAQFVKNGSGAVADLAAKYKIADSSVSGIYPKLKKYGELLGISTANGYEEVAAVRNMVEAFIALREEQKKQLKVQIGLAKARKDFGLAMELEQQYFAVDISLRNASATATETQTEEQKDLNKEFDTQAKTVKTAMERLKEYSSALKGYGSEQKGYMSAVKGTKTAQDSLATSTANVGKAQEHFNTVVRGYGAGSKEAIKATKNLSQAQRDAQRAGIALADAQEAVTAAQKKLADLQKGADPRSIQEAQDDITEATYGVSDAEQALQEALATGKAKDIALAEIDLRDARNGLTDATEALAEMQKAADPQALIDAQQELDTAQLNLTEAQIAQKDATDAVTTAQTLLNESISGAAAGSDAYEEALKLLNEAKMAEVEASEAVTEAIDKEAEAKLRLADAERELNAARKGTTAPQRATAEKQTGVDDKTVGGKRREFLDTVNKQFNAKYKSIAEYIAAGANATSKANRKARFNTFAKANNIPEMAKGGIVNSPTLALIGERGPEAVVPLDRMNNSGGDIYNITINSKIADSTLPDLLVAELRKFNRRSGAINIQVA